MRALVWASLVTMPDCEPVKLTAGTPRALSAIESRAIEIRSPADSSMSSSRRAGLSLTCLARASRSSVVSPMAETTTTTSLPAPLAAATRSATFWIFPTSAMEDPPYFWTMIGTRQNLRCHSMGEGQPGGIGGRRQRPAGGARRDRNARGRSRRRARRPRQRDEPRQGRGQHRRKPPRLPRPPPAHHLHLRHRQRIPLGALGLRNDGVAEGIRADA